MECLLCGKNYINLGVHLRHKHHEDPDEYREQFGLMKTTPLVDKALSQHISKAAKRRLLNLEYLKDVTQQCQENAKNNVGRSPGSMSKAGLANLAARNAKVHAARLVELAPTVKKILDEKKTILDVRRAIGMGRNAVIKIVKSGAATYDKSAARRIGSKRSVESRLKNKQYADT